MAIDKAIWEKIKADYEAGNIEEDKAFTQLSNNYLVDRTTITKKAKKENWIYGKNSQIITLETSVIKNIQEINEKKSHLNHTELMAVERGVKRELEKEEINSNTFHIAKILQTQLMEAIPLMKIDDLKPKDITGALKDIHDMNNPKDVASINIQNTNAVQTNTNIIGIENMDDKQITNAYLDLIKQ